MLNFDNSTLNMVLRIFTSGFLTALECTRALPWTPLGSLQCSLDPLAGLRGHTSKGKGRERREEGERKEREGMAPHFANSWSRGSVPESYPRGKMAGSNL